MFISDSIKTEVTTVTPRMAEDLLAKNTSNRRVSRNNYVRVKEAMERGEWELNGEAIKIARDGRILDGQHRLMVCAELGKSFDTLIVYGLLDETQDTMDTGKSRTIADVFTLNGVPNAARMAAIVAAIIRAENYGLKAGLYYTSGGYPVTAKQALARLESEPALHELNGTAQKVRKLGLGSALPATLYYHFSKLDTDDADYFFDKLATGEALENGDPILTLRNHLVNLMSERGERNKRYISAVFIKAWNKYRAGEQCLLLKFRPGGANPEAFPEPK